MLPWLFASLRGYRIGSLPRDFIAGMMLAAIAIPGQLATARLAGMPPETGLYAFAAGSLAFAAFGANRFMSVAADSTIAPIFAGALASWAAAGTPHYAELVTLLALMVGAILLVVGLLRAGWLATLLSTPVTTGFLAGIAIHIMVGELPTLLGIPAHTGAHGPDGFQPSKLIGSVSCQLLHLMEPPGMSWCTGLPPPCLGALASSPDAAAALRPTEASASR